LFTSISDETTSAAFGAGNNETECRNKWNLFWKKI